MRAAITQVTTVAMMPVATPSQAKVSWVERFMFPPRGSDK